MHTYDVKIEPFKPKLKHKLIGVLVLVLLYGVIFFFAHFLLGVLFPPRIERQGSVDRLVADAGVAFIIWIFGWLLMYSILNRPDRDNGRDFKLVVETDSITAVYPKRQLLARKGRIRSVFDIEASSLRPGGIGISEKSEFAARMLGFVFVPNTLLEFEELKKLVEGWREADHSME